MEMGFRNWPSTKLELTQSAPTPTIVFHCWLMSLSHGISTTPMTAMRMVQPYRCGPNQSSGGTDLEAGDVKETFVAFFSESRWMDAPSPSPAYSCRRRQSAVSLNSLDPGSTAADGPFLIYAGKPRNCAISTHCIARFLPFPSFIAFEEETTFPSLWRPPSPSRHQVHQTKV